uniref:Uncharacterized protein n=1 Tax=Oryza brachyantha TaxID=4533 RepID=J3MUM6_ORYBR
MEGMERGLVLSSDDQPPGCLPFCQLPTKPVQPIAAWEEQPVLLDLLKVYVEKVADPQNAHAGLTDHEVDLDFATRRISPLEAYIANTVLRRDIGYRGKGYLISRALSIRELECVEVARCRGGVDGGAGATGREGRMRQQRGRGGGRGEPGMLTRAVEKVFRFVRLAEFEILFVLFFLIAFVLFKDLMSRPQYNSIFVKKPDLDDRWP